MAKRGKPAWQKFFSNNSVAEQFLIWNVLTQLAQPLLAPVEQAIASEVWSLDPNVPLSPEAAASMVAREKLVGSQGEDIAVKSGIGREAFRLMVSMAKHPPPFEALVEGCRRKLISATGDHEASSSLYTALAEMGVDERWWNMMSELVINKPSGQAGLQALLQGQISREKAYAIWLEAGEDPDWFQDAFNSEGTAPTPDMAGAMANRRIIPWEGNGPDKTSFEQAFLEGPWRNKWLGPMRKLMEYLPPPRTTTAMVRDGSLTDAMALELWEKEGLTPELARAYLRSAHHSKVETEKELSKSEIARLYKEAKIPLAKAVELIQALGYSKANAELILSMAQIQKADTHLTAAINKVRALYIAHKISRPAATSSLDDLKVAKDQAKELMDLWDLEASLNVRQLNPAQIIAAWEYKIITEAEARQELVHLGYTEFDAWVLLSTKKGKALENKPKPGGGPGVNP